MTLSSRSRRHLAGFLGLVTGGALGQVVAFIATPILAALYGKPAFGLLASVTALATPAAVGLVARLDLAIAGEPVVRRATELRHALRRHVVLSAALLLSIVAIVYLVSHVSGDKPIAAEFLLVPAVALAVALNWTEAQSATALGEYRRVATAALLATTTTVLLRLVLGGVAPSGWSLLAGLVGGQTLAMMLLVHGHRGRLDHFGRRLTFRQVYGRYRDFVRFRLPQDMLNTVGAGAPALIVAAHSGAEYAGIFWMVIRLVRVPVGVVLEAAKRVVYREVGRDVSNVSTIWWQWTRFAAAFAVVLIVAGITLGPLLADLLLDDEWREVQSLIPFAVLQVASQATAAPGVAVLPAIQAQRGLFAFEIGATAIRLVSLSSLLAALSPLDALAGFFVVNTVLYLVLAFLCAAWTRRFATAPV